MICHTVKMDMKRILLHLLITSFATTKGQTLHPHKLCEDKAVYVDNKTYGYIEYKKSTNSFSGNCAMAIHGQSTFAFTNFHGIDPKRFCSGGSYSEITIDNVPYCVKGPESTNLVMHQKRNSNPLVIRLVKAKTDYFNFSYYNQVVKCNENFEVDWSEPNFLSAVLVSKTNLFIPLNSLQRRQQCSHMIKNLPFASTVVRFDVLYMSNTTVKATYFSNMVTYGDVIKPFAQTSSQRDSTVQPIGSKAHAVHVDYLVKVTIEHCQDIPGANLTNVVLPDTPWFPGAMVESNYSCLKSFYYSATESSFTECIYDFVKLKAIWKDNPCKPLPRCQLPPPTIENARYTLSEDELTAVYTCIERGSSNYFLSQRTITCRSPIPGVEPATWSLSDIKCGSKKSSLLIVVVSATVAGVFLLVGIVLCVRFSTGRKRQHVEPKNFKRFIYR